MAVHIFLSVFFIDGKALNEKGNWLHHNWLVLEVLATKLRSRIF